MKEIIYTKQEILDIFNYKLNNNQYDNIDCEISQNLKIISPNTEYINSSCNYIVYNIKNKRIFYIKCGRFQKDNNSSFSSVKSKDLYNNSAYFAKSYIFGECKDVPVELYNDSVGGYEYRLIDGDIVIEVTKNYFYIKIINLLKKYFLDLLSINKEIIIQFQDTWGEVLLRNKEDVEKMEIVANFNTGSIFMNTTSLIKLNANINYPNLLESNLKSNFSIITK